MADDTFEQYLQAGIAAARSGKKAEARAALRNALQANPRSAPAWLWMSGVVATLQEREKCLERVLTLEPNNAPALKALPTVRAQVTAELLREGLALVESGPPTAARETLMHVLERDEENVAAWLGLSEVAETLEDIEICLENVLTLDPDNTGANLRLNALRERMAAPGNALFTPWETATEPESGIIQNAVIAAIPGQDYSNRRASEFFETLAPPDPPSVALWEKFEDAYLCPYCAAPTAPENRRCPTCKQPLWLTVRRQQKTSTLLYILMAIQATNTVFAALAPLILVSIVAVILGLRDPFTQVLPLYLGGTNNLPPEIAQRALQMLPRLVFYLSGIPALFSLAILVGLYVRWKPLYYIMLVNAVLQVIGSLLSILARALIPGLIGVGLAVLQFFLVLQVEDDFMKEKIRVLLRLDEDAKGTTGLLMRGRLYAGQGMWALAAIHYRRAAATVRNQTTAHLALAAACIKLQEYELAELALEDAQRINPHDGKIAEMTQLLEQKRGISASDAAIE